MKYLFDYEHSWKTVYINCTRKHKKRMFILIIIIIIIITQSRTYTDEVFRMKAVSHPDFKYGDWAESGLCKSRKFGEADLPTNLSLRRESRNVEMTFRWVLTRGRSVEHRGAEYHGLLCLYWGSCSGLTVSVCSLWNTVPIDLRAERLSTFCYSFAQLNLGIC